MSDGGNGVACARPPSWRDCVHADKDVELADIHGAKPTLKAVTLEPRHGSHTLRHEVRLVGLEENGRPIPWVEGPAQETERSIEVDCSHASRGAEWNWRWRLSHETQPRRKTCHPRVPRSRGDGSWI